MNSTFKDCPPSTMTPPAPEVPAAQWIAHAGTNNPASLLVEQSKKKCVDRGQKLIQIVIERAPNSISFQHQAIIGERDSYHVAGEVLEFDKAAGTSWQIAQLTPCCISIS